MDSIINRLINKFILDQNIAIAMLVFFRDVFVSLTPWIKRKQQILALRQHSKKFSVVMVSRNDGYGGYLEERAVYCLNAMVATFDEVIYIDWNSPGKNLVEQVRSRLLKTGKLTCISVSQEMADKLTRYNAHAQQCCEVLGRNIGIRRATGDWIVSSNIDIIPSPRALLEELVTEKSVFYIARRAQVSPSRIFGFDYRQSLALQEYLNNHKHTYEACPFFPPDNELHRWSLISCNGDFQAAHRSLWDAVKGFEEGMIYRMYADTNVQKKAALAGFNLKVMEEYPIFHCMHGGGGGNAGRLNDMERYIDNFVTTTNTIDWGFPQIDFETTTL